MLGGGGGAISDDSGGGAGGAGGTSQVPQGGTSSLAAVGSDGRAVITYTEPVSATPIAVRGGGTVRSAGRSVSVAVDARSTAEGTASGRVGVSGPAALTFGSSSISTVTRDGNTVTVTGTGVGSDGRTGPFTITVVDNGTSGDRVTVQRGGATASGVLSPGNMTIG